MRNTFGRCSRKSAIQKKNSSTDMRVYSFNYKSSLYGRFLLDNDSSSIPPPVRVVSRQGTALAARNEQVDG
ncbi:hypothetical protein Y032_0479g2213 [Ancylostoma ceylanicum]|uniref:Uncharacterized protein n=1 Tax=Ancylostoma ceylanicum TaxID=53326 RepID=A0A016WVY6_9BILA|nr:hypothetical protein Y032_0479g2213 [Ancylostoma ceylanicum]